MMTDPGNVRGWGVDYLKTPAFLRREGRRKRKAGAKNEKASFIIAVYMQRSTEKSLSRNIYPGKIPRYPIEWYEDRIDFFLDDEKYFTFENEGTGNAVWPFDKPHYLILNAAVGGTWGGQKGIDDTIFPQKYHIDYVRVFKKR